MKISLSWKYKSNGELTLIHDGIEKIFKGVSLFRINGVINKYLVSIGHGDQVKNSFSIRENATKSNKDVGGSIAKKKKQAIKRCHSQHDPKYYHNKNRRKKTAH